MSVFAFLSGGMTALRDSSREWSSLYPFDLGFLSMEHISSSVEDRLDG